MLGKITSFLSGGMGEKLVGGAMEIIKGRFPAKMSEAEQAQVEQDLMTLTGKIQNEALALANEEKAEFNQRIKELEGTAADLKTIPVLGPIIIFLRGVQRPAWGFVTMYFDYKWFVSSETYTEQQQTALILINFLVLTFLFGERAIKNVMPIILNYFEKKNG